LRGFCHVPPMWMPLVGSAAGPQTSSPYVFEASDEVVDVGGEEVHPGQTARNRVRWLPGSSLGVAPYRALRERPPDPRVTPRLPPILGAPGNHAPVPFRDPEAIRV
jgi:hypothetical protein